ncbi:MAG: hypothetical protein J0L84_19300 [Verrucomicrobia bacterium]|nr:hypothetical protein [Verrucomicrobiota bacterium]
MKPLETWFATTIYHHALRRQGAAAFQRELLQECRQLREFDDAGRRWSRRNYPGGYTSYGSMDRLHQFSSTFAELERRLDRHVAAFARALSWDLGGRPLRMTDCWVNFMPRGVAHSLHLHPNSVVSGTYYVATPRGCAGLKFEDPRLSRFMASPPRLASAPPSQQVHVLYPAVAGRVTLFESWLRHEVVANPVRAERISISFNYDW